MRRRAILAAGLALPFAAHAANDQPAFAVGQVWRLVGVTNGRATIGRIEPFSNDTAVHISARADLPLAPGMSDTVGAPLVVAHLPFSIDAFRRSVDVLLEEGAAPEPHFQEGYDTWRTAVEREGAGIFTVTFAELMNASLRRR